VIVGDVNFAEINWRLIYRQVGPDLGRKGRIRPLRTSRQPGGKCRRVGHSGVPPTGSSTLEGPPQTGGPSCFRCARAKIAIRLASAAPFARRWPGFVRSILARRRPRTRRCPRERIQASCAISNGPPLTHGLRTRDKVGLAAPSGRGRPGIARGK
jgi:hypothetical protein